TGLLHFVVFFLRLFLLMCYFFFFFFQAEDGIRDRNVTGVQTCALPIFRIRHALVLLNSTALPIHAIAASCGYSDINYFIKIFKRSEERRVGKECRSRWLGYS